MAAGVTGEICVRGPNVIAGYEGRRQRLSFLDGWFRTGDLGYLDADGYLYITGRLREVINRGGEKIAPREIEELLLAPSRRERRGGGRRARPALWPAGRRIHYAARAGMRWSSGNCATTAPIV